MDCRESISSIPDYFFPESDQKQNKTKQNPLLSLQSVPVLPKL